jgi:hypothetical protein
MSLEDEDAVDGWVRSPDGKPELIIVDDHIWNDDEERWSRLLDKLRSYIGFILGDEFAAQFPGTEACDVTIRVVCTQPPTQRMQQFTSFAPVGDETNRIKLSYSLASSSDA